MTTKASVQFVQPMTFRVIKVLTEFHTYHGWVWLRGYQLDDKRNAVANREIFVQPAGLVVLRKRPAQPAATVNAQRRRNMSPVVSRSTAGAKNQGVRTGTKGPEGAATDRRR
ncbi:hypothetical protein [Micromonospora carbonacea]|uniref:hypothetical protein n=1 Tax=Micromonospora carbonacea TaxID=47853 RepID=UPI00210D4FC0|nr:hypothetical protein [Micromonospora carbonacea]